MNVAVIGAGWAGLSAAAQLCSLGHQVTVFEASRTLGGRARRVTSPAFGTAIDNGQHILLGAYSDTLALMTQLRLDASTLFCRERLLLQSADGHFRLQAPALPAPLHLLGAVLTARGLTFSQKIALITLTRRLQRNRWKVTPGTTVAQWLEQGGQGRQVIRQFWQPLCLAAMNTPIADACAQLFAHVLKDSLGGHRHASDTLIPRVNLSALWPDQVTTLGDKLRIHAGHAVRQLQYEHATVLVDQQAFDAAIVATNVPSAQRLLTQLPATSKSSSYLQALDKFDYLPIATVTLELERPWAIPHTMLMLNEDPERQYFGQWLFNRNVFMASAPGHIDTKLTIVISDARQLLQHPREHIISAIIGQISEQTTRFGEMPAVIASELITEKRASFAATPGLLRPSCTTPWDNIYSAGDWTDTGYPGVLEGAVRSGKAAANLVHQHRSAANRTALP